jgi:hypothetical protein
MSSAVACTWRNRWTAALSLAYQVVAMSLRKALGTVLLGCIGLRHTQAPEFHGVHVHAEVLGVSCEALT